MSLGATVELTAMVLDENGQAVAGAVVTWESSDESVATVSSQGLVTAVQNGVAQITARSGSASSGIAVKVESLPPSPDRDTLVTLYNSMGGPDWSNNTNWLSDKHVEEWHGVNTDEEGRVNTLNLGSNNLKGLLPIELGQLSNLEGLALDDNQLTGSIPSELGQLTNLIQLYLFDNQLTGPIPPELSQLHNLIHLCLNGNRLTGSIPPELGELSSLKWLHLHTNENLSGALPVALTKLELDALLLQDTQVCVPDDPELTRWLDEISDVRIVAECEGFDIERIVLELLYTTTDGENWQNNTNWLSDAPLGDWHGVETDVNGRVTGIRLDYNELSGSMPPELVQLTNLTVLSLHKNNLSGELPPKLGRMTSLTSLKLGDNQLTGIIPSELGNLAQLTELRLNNNHLTGIIPVELGNLEQLGYLGLSVNQLTGIIPSELGNLAQLTYLNLGGNQLTGSIPSELGNLAQLTELRLGDCHLTGRIPAELGNLAQLTELILGHNNLAGSIPVELAKLKNLVFLSLPGNQLSGEIPPELGQLTGLSTLSLLDNRLTGTIPPELGKLGELSYLGFSYNWLLSGTLPIELTALKKLEVLHLVGTLVCVPNDASFQEWLDVIGIKIVTACTSPDRAPLVALFHATGGDNWDNDTDWLSGKTLDHWFGVSTDSDGRVGHLSLESNNLSGVVPDALGGLAGLKSLHLGSNPSLTGALPYTLTKLSLVSLRLDGTQLCTPVDVEFQTWLNNIPDLSGVMRCEKSEENDDRSLLTRFYYVSNGPNWINDTNWLSDTPLEEWYGVSTDDQGRVTRLELLNNNLVGTIPKELGQLSNLKVLNLYDNQLAGSIPPELGQLTRLNLLSLWNNELTGSIPAELGQLSNLEELNLSGNKLTGSIPPELGQLVNLTSLSLTFNSLTGSIPAELGQLSNLEELNLNGNKLTGSIPPELERLALLEVLDLTDIQSMSGEIPPELGKLTNLKVLRLGGMSLTGSIPIELAELADLSQLNIGSNQLNGSIPPELGQLSNLRELILGGNDLSGTIPVELGNMESLVILNLSDTKLSGKLPDELARLVNLKELRLRDNEGLIGPLPVSLTALNLRDLLLEKTGLCTPTDSTFKVWFENIPNRDIIPICRTEMSTDVYLTQAVQSFKRPVPLIEGEPALLRVFLATEEVVTNRPSVRASFYVEGNEVYSVEIPPGYAKVPIEIDEGSLDKSANALVPAEAIITGLEMVVRIDLDESLGSDAGIDMRIPESGRMAIDVRTVPPLDLTLVPLLWIEDPDYSVVTESQGLTSDSDMFRLTRDLLPINEFNVSVRRNPLLVSVDPILANKLELLKELLLIHMLDGKGGHSMGIIKSGGNGGKGTPTFLSSLDGKNIAHELGHNLSLSHSPCNNPQGIDPYYPYPAGNIGAWGFDYLSGTLIHPGTPDIMGYCRNAWISDYHFNRLLKYRQSDEYMELIAPPDDAMATRALLLWGGLNENGGLSIEPAFVVDATPSLPRDSGPYLISGQDLGGNTLFSLSFTMSQTADGEGGGFAFAIPVQQLWLGRLARITLSGPEGFTEMTREGGRPAALLLDRSTGEVRGILRDWPERGMSAVPTRRVLPEPGLDVIVSPGIPDPSDW